ncbi:hypothetical protein LSAT2_027602 [Lamellibrachia satsuma]|nr:hypothetical protein LSAT2_027602 [Lamellibrachia satsuma]
MKELLSSGSTYHSRSRWPIVVVEVVEEERARWPIVVVVVVEEERARWPIVVVAVVVEERARYLCCVVVEKEWVNMDVKFSAFLALLAATIFPVVEAQSDSDGSLVPWMIMALIFKVITIAACCACRSSSTQSTTEVFIVPDPAGHVNPAVPGSSATVPPPFEGGVAPPEVSLAMSQLPPPSYSEATAQGTASPTPGSSTIVHLPVDGSCATGSQYRSDTATATAAQRCYGMKSNVA